MQKTVNSRNHGLVLFNPYIGPLSGATTLGHGSDGNKRVLRVLQSSSITGTSPSDCYVLYPGHWLVGVLPLCREAVGVFYSPSRQGKILVFAKSSKLGQYLQKKKKRKEKYASYCVMIISFG